MAENSKIEWTHHTQNFWLGCTKVSPACDHCYAEHLMDHRMHRVEWGGPRVPTSDAVWRAPYKWDREAKAAGERRRVFTLSLGDFFDNQVDRALRDRAWLVIKECRNLDWLILTKRPQNIAKMLPATVNTGEPWGEGWPHVWLGTTVENQEEADRRIPHLLAVPAVVRFLSCEPLLGAIDLDRSLWQSVNPRDIPGSALNDGCGSDYLAARKKLHWVITGGESGPGARPMSIHWARGLRDQCQAAGIPFFFKQWGEWAPPGSGRYGDPGRYAFGDYDHDDGELWPNRFIEVDGYPRDFTMFGARALLKRVGKKTAGRMLDGRTWDEMPGEICR